jgi:hypothetical protein
MSCWVHLVQSIKVVKTWLIVAVQEAVMVLMKWVPFLGLLHSF